MQKTQFALLGKQKFLPLFLTQFLGAFNDNLYKNALVVMITYLIADRLTVQTNILVTLTGCLMILPMVLFSAQAGYLADKYEKSSLIRKVKILEIILMGFGVIGFIFQSVYFLMFIMFLMGAQATLFGPLKYSILPEHLQEDELIGGNGLIEMGTFVSILLGNILGAILVMLPNGLILIGVAVVFVALLGYLSSRFIPIAPSGSADLKVPFNSVKATYHVLSELKARKSLYTIVLAISWFWLMGFVFLAQFPNFAKDYVHGNEDVFILFLALFSIGIGVGSVCCNTLLKGKITLKYVPLAALGISLFTIDLYFAARHVAGLHTGALLTVSAFIAEGHHWRILLDIILISLCGGLYAVPLYTLLQHRAETAFRSRMIGANNIMNALFMTIGTVVVIILIKIHFTIPEIFLWMAIINLFVILLLWRFCIAENRES